MKAKAPSGLVICSLMWLLAPVTCGAVQPGYYPPKPWEKSLDVVPESDSEHELHELMNDRNAVSLLVDAKDKIRIASLTAPIPESFQNVWHTQEEVAVCLKDLSTKKLLRVCLSVTAMWGPAEKSEALARELDTFVHRFGYERVLILGLKPHDDGRTFMHPNNGCMRVGIFVFKDTGNVSPNCGARTR